MAREITEYDRARGRRLREIREALGLSQAAIVDHLNAAANELGLPARYEYYTVSRMEKGSVSFEDAAVWLRIDPAREASAPPRWDWFVFGPAKGRPPKQIHPSQLQAVPKRTPAKRASGG